MAYGLPGAIGTLNAEHEVHSVRYGAIHLRRGGGWVGAREAAQAGRRKVGRSNGGVALMWRGDAEAR